MAWVTQKMIDIWESGAYIGENTPKAVVQIQLGHFQTAWWPWHGPRVGAQVWGEGNFGPDNAQSGHWFPKWFALSDWYDIPNIVSVKRTRDFTQKGVTVAEILVDALDYVAQNGADGDPYHRIVPGWLAPDRGYVAPGRPRLPWQREDSPWSPSGGESILRDSVRVRVWQGFGDPETADGNTPPTNGGSNGAWTFAGIIDDVDGNSSPSQLTLTARNGKLLTDQHVFRAAKSVQLKDPITFWDSNAGMDRTLVARGAHASSYQDDAHRPKMVLDAPGNCYQINNPAYRSRWHSAGNISPSHIEWVEIRVPAGEYESFWLASKPGMLCYVGVYVKKRDKLVETAPHSKEYVRQPLSAEVDDHAIGEGWWGSHVVPGQNWKYLRTFVTGAGLDTPAGHNRGFIGGEELAIDNPGLGHKFTLGDNSIIRLGFAPASGFSGGRASVANFHAVRRVEKKVVKQQQYILVDDASDVVKVTLRWAGFQEWVVEKAGVRLSDGTNYGPGVVAKASGTLTFNRSKYLIDIIDEMTKQLGWIFYIADPVDANSWGVPTCRRDSSLLVDENYVAAQLDENTMLTGFKLKHTDADKPAVIRIRGKTQAAKDGGLPLGGDSIRRIMVTYNPPWYYDGRNAGILRHIVYEDDQLVTYAQCLYGALQYAMNAALQMHTAVGEIPAHPMLELDDQVVVTDEATATNGRLWIVKLEDTMQLGEGASWKQTFEGSLLDTRDLQQVIAEAQGRRKVHLGSPNGPISFYIDWNHVIEPGGTGSDGSSTTSGYIDPIRRVDRQRQDLPRRLRDP